MLDIFTAPGAAFTRLKDKPSWLLPLILALVASMAVSTLRVHYVDWNEQRAVATEKMRERNMTDEQIEQALAGMEKLQTSPLLRYGLPAFGALLTGIIAVLFITVIYNVSLPLLGATPGFRRTLSVVTNAGLVAIPSAIVNGLLIVLRRSAEATTSLLVFFPGIREGFPAVVLSRVELFALWQLFLTGLGLKLVHDIKGNRSWWLVVGLYVFLTLVFGLLGGRAGR
uniref:Yip1 domain-containing protein n=1 Tax=candidate division WOR-3 bacterium TaxID=2052148 RepID=A0A7C4GGQ9_UNCW3